MKHIFLSYTYHPHPAHEGETDTLQRNIRRVIEAMDLRVVDGLDLGGRVLGAEVERRIDAADALIAIYTPQADATGQPDEPAFVDTEFQRARTSNKPTLRVVRTGLTLRGLGATDEYAPFDPARMLDVVMKVLGTIAVWKKDGGRGVEIRIQPDDLAARFDRRNDRCEYELMVASGQTLPSKETKLWPEPGGPTVYVPNFVEGARVSIRLEVAGERWRSPFVAPHLGGIVLVKS